MRILSVDPGTRGCAGALWSDAGELVLAAYAPNPLKKGSGPRECAASALALVREMGVEYFDEGDALVLEWPQVYQRGGGRTKGDANDLLPLAGIDAAIAALLPHAHAHYLSPQDWKGNVPKPESAAEDYVIESRVRARLKPEELARVRWPESARHRYDVADACGVGLHFLKRFQPVRVYPRE